MSNIARFWSAEELYRPVPTGWTDKDYGRLECELEPYVGWIERCRCEQPRLPSHIPGSGSLAVPVGETKTPAELFAALGSDVAYECETYDGYWLTVHYPNPEPVVTLIPQVSPGIPASLIDICRRCSDALGQRVGGPGGAFLAYLLPGFSWAMHTDHDNKYEQIAARVHIPLITTPESLYVWGEKGVGGPDRWIVQTHLPACSAYYVRVDVPHTVANQHRTSPRLHLILDVQEES